MTSITEYNLAFYSHLLRDCEPDKSWKEKEAKETETATHHTHKNIHALRITN